MKKVKDERLMLEKVTERFLRVNASLMTLFSVISAMSVIIVLELMRLTKEYLKSSILLSSIFLLFLMVYTVNENYKKEEGDIL